MNAIYPVVLSGGSGTRLWPLSRASYPKQFIRFFNDQQSSFLAATLKRLPIEGGFAAPIIVCNNEHRFLVKEEAEHARVAPRAVVSRDLVGGRDGDRLAHLSGGARSRGAGGGLPAGTLGRSQCVVLEARDRRDLLRARRGPQQRAAPSRARKLRGSGGIGGTSLPHRKDSRTSASGAGPQRSQDGRERRRGLVALKPSSRSDNRVRWPPIR